MPKRSPFIVIEGSDGSGKTVQVKLLVGRLRQEGFSVSEFSFPRYGNPSASLVKDYLEGKFGDVKSVSPEQASMCYAMDRFAAAPEIRSAQERGDVIILNRYAASNFAHQGAKIKDDDERRAFFEWLHQFEFGTLEIPKPDLNIVLHVPSRVSEKLIKARNAQQHPDGNVPRDIHEENSEYLARVVPTYLELVKFYPDEFRLVECVAKGRLLSIEEIHEKVWAIVQKLLPRLA